MCRPNERGRRGKGPRVALLRLSHVKEAGMKSIRIYARNAERIRRLCIEYKLTAAELVEILLDNITGQELKLFR